MESFKQREWRGGYLSIQSSECTYRLVKFSMKEIDVKEEIK